MREGDIVYCVKNPKIYNDFKLPIGIPFVVDFIQRDFKTVYLKDMKKGYSMDRFISLSGYRKSKLQKIDDVDEE